MPQIIDYTSLSSAITNWEERAHDADELIGLAEAEFRIYLGPDYVKETTATLSFVSGVATIPTGYTRAIALSHPTGGPMTQTSWESLAVYNPFDVSGIPALYALSGTQIKTAPLFDGTASFTYEGGLSPLTPDNTTNWLIERAPQAYLAMCQSFGKAKFEDYQNAALLRQAALGTLDQLGIQATVGRYGHAGMTIRGATP